MRLIGWSDGFKLLTCVNNGLLLVIIRALVRVEQHGKFTELIPSLE